MKRPGLAGVIASHKFQLLTTRERRPPLRLAPCAAILHHAEFTRIALATSVGFLIMGFIGFFVKLVHIPINNIIVGGV